MGEAGQAHWMGTVGCVEWRGNPWHWDTGVDGNLSLRPEELWRAPGTDSCSQGVLPKWVSPWWLRRRPDPLEGPWAKKPVDSRTSEHEHTDLRDQLRTLGEGP